MPVITSLKAEALSPKRIKTYSSRLRLWHWANALIIVGSLLTVLINSTLTNGRTITPLIQNELKNIGVAVTGQLAGNIGHALSDLVWEVHTWFGYVLAVLLLFRIVLEFFQLADQKFLRKIRAAYRQFQLTKNRRELARHDLLVKGIYTAFYLLIVIMVVTGLFLAFEDFMAPFKSIRHTVKNVHGFCMYLIIAFILVHVAGVFLAERKDSPGITSDMINGGIE